MNFGSKERWAVLRQLHEVHAIPFEMLAIVANMKPASVSKRATREDWAIGGEGAFDLKASRALVARVAAVTRARLEELAANGEISAVAEKQMRMFSTLITSIHKHMLLTVEIEQDDAPKNKDNRGKDGDDAGQAGEHILALRAAVEAFIDALGEEEADPQISGEIE